MPDPCIQEQTIGEHNAEIQAFKTYMEDQKSYHRMVGGALIGVVFTIFLQIVGFGYLWGQVTSQVKRHDNILEQICTLSLRQQNQIEKLQ